MPNNEVNSHFEDEMWDDPDFKIYMAGVVAREVADRCNDIYKGEIPHHGAWMTRRGRGPRTARKPPCIVHQMDEGRTVLVVNTDHAAALLEWGGQTRAGIDVPAYAPLRRGTRAAGLDFRATPAGKSDRVLDI